MAYQYDRLNIIRALRLNDTMASTVVDFEAAAKKAKSEYGNIANVPYGMKFR